eukprot:CAMPEP_0198307288 /NCGR_PEP_ID=MMETSP1450-20131203/198_1 /TAXON_ID=753684 ORGANISM="Madagascaria erythrocladiodes, Strain CCMP3234" /NCGR_SAMPLE_ID=MMETSP1450 /ASSEMBLY_ACC=CAM_ASM_001115 /LENGTH=335 /DNA_ID=CAMNT_0044009859 /DNA_START=107 /DNA_END=1114 /DNA_ORIENTATION=+
MIVFVPVVVGMFLWMLYELFYKPPTDIAADGKAFLVTGAASGIGMSVVKLLLQRGALVYAADVNVAALEKVYGNEKRVRKVKMDVTKQNDVDKFVASLGEVGSVGGGGGGSSSSGSGDGWPAGLYGVVNCAGVAWAPGKKRPNGEFYLSVELDCDTEEVPIIDINLNGTIRVVNAVAQHIVASKGVIVNIASLAGRFGSPGMTFPAYVASKHAVNGITKCWRYELEKYGVRVYAMEPWFIQTPMVTEGFKDDGKVDLSKTKFPRSFDESKLAKQRQKVQSTMMDPTAVSSEVVRVLLTSKQQAGHIIVAPPIIKVVLTIVSTLPHKWQDKLRTVL